jgi:1A family penicillin-binding protein
MAKMNKLIILLMVICVAASSMFFTGGLPDIAIVESSTLYDVNGEPIRGLAEENRINITYDDIPDAFVKAIIAVEDKNFFNHHGFDISGILRAFITNLKEGRISAGGSTITQQTAKNLFLSNDRTFSRKIKELYYAIQLERKYSKEEILALYCNTIYFGHGAYGLEVAARTYFAKKARELSVAECALLAGIPMWPSRYDPLINPQDARERQKVVVQRMVEEGFLDPQMGKKILQEALIYKSARFLGGDAPYFIAMVKDYLIDKYGERTVFQGGLKVYTTLDLKMQKAANVAYEEGMAGRDPDLQAVLLALDVKNGEIRALIGGRDFAQSSYNRVYAKRQPGSTFKPFMYSLALTWGVTAAEMVECDEVEFRLPNGDVYRPTDYGKEPYHLKQFTLKEALMISDNVIAVKVNNTLGPQAAAKHAEAFGFSNIQPILSLPLGSNEVRPIDLAAGYSVFANQGIYTEPSFIIKVTDNNGRILEEKQLAQKKVIGADIAYIITDMLSGVLQPGGTGAGLRKYVGERPAAGKTGTTDEFKDAWFVGYTPRICCVVWVGYDKGKSANLTGSVAAGPIWGRFMEEVTQRLARDDFFRPANVTLQNICLDTGMTATDYCPRKMEMAFREGTEPLDICDEHKPRLTHRRDWWNWPEERSGEEEKVDMGEESPVGKEEHEDQSSAREED